VNYLHPSANAQVKLDQFLVCGLGSLGQHCVAALKEFGVSVIAIEQVPLQHWEVANVADLLDNLIVGDCRQKSVLEQAKIEHCRAALIVTTNEQHNIETALAVRQLNPYTRLVVRSATNNLNQLLSEQLGNFIAYDPTELPTNAFALGALGTEILGFFNLDGHWLTVVESQAGQNLAKNFSHRLHEWNTETRKILIHTSLQTSSSPTFNQWNYEGVVNPEDRLVYLETSEHLVFHPQAKSVSSSPKHQPKQKNFFGGLYFWLKRCIHKFLELSFQQQVRRVAIIYSLVLLILLITGVLLYKNYYPQITWSASFYATVILLMGGYGDVYGGNVFEHDPAPWWLKLFSLGLTLVGSAFVGVLYALFNEILLSAKFQLVKRRPPVPKSNHLVIIGLTGLGTRIIKLLQDLKQRVVGVSFDSNFERNALPDTPLIVGSIAEALDQANLSTATSVVVVTDNELRNLEVALMAGRINPRSHLVIQTYGQNLNEHLQKLLPHAQVLGTHAVAAEVFAGAAFGENIINLFRLNQRTILVTEYQIEAGDTLNGLLLADIAYGYSVVPILHQRPPYRSLLMPADEIRLEIGDRLVVLATIEGLQWIEVGKRHPKEWLVRVDSLPDPAITQELKEIFTYITGCSLSSAKNAIAHLPGIINYLLYKQQGQQLVRALSKLHIKAYLQPISNETLVEKIVF